MKCEFPGPYAPPPPRVSLSLPELWDPVIYPGTILTARKQVPTENFSANILITWVRHADGFQLEEAVQAVELELSLLPEAALLEPLVVEANGAAAAGRAVAFRDPGVGSLAQFHLLFLLPEGKANDLIHVTGTIGGDRIDQDLPEVQGILRSVSVEQGRY